MTNMSAAVMLGPTQFEIGKEPVPEPAPGHVLVHVRNCGSELHFYNGGFPARQRMRMGHEISGEVARMGHDVSGLSTDQRVVIEPLLIAIFMVWSPVARRRKRARRRMSGVEVR